MKLIAILHTTDYRGDHTAEITRLYEVVEGETVTQLVERIGLTDKPDKWGAPNPDHIEIKPVLPHPPKEG